jgi:hypothetical protein
MTQIFFFFGETSLSFFSQCKQFGLTHDVVRFAYLIDTIKHSF